MSATVCISAEGREVKKAFNGRILPGVDELELSFDRLDSVRQFRIETEVARGGRHRAIPRRA
jgi:hypothetical protein